jgi:hypothetical protein
MKTTKITDVSHYFWKRKAAEYQCKFETILEAALEIAARSEHQYLLRQIVATLKNAQNSLAVESKQLEASETMLDPLCSPQTPPKRRTSVSVPADAVTTPASQIWRAYSESMKTLWNTEPPRNAKVNAQCKMLHEAVGLNTALALARYYPTRCKKFYVQQGFPIGLLLTDYPSLLLEMANNTKLTDRIVHKLVENEEAQEASKRLAVEPLDPFSIDDEQLALAAPKTLMLRGES